MKKLNLLTLIVLITGLILTSVFCKRLDLERITKVKIGEITEQTNNTATISAEVFDVSESASRRGICYGTEANPEVTANVIWQEQAPLIGTYSTQITNIDAGTYYVRAVAEDNTGFVYSEELTFTVGVVDIDGNKYRTIKLGNQEWMAENLKVTKYPNGANVPLVTSDLTWLNLEDNNSDDAYCYFNNNTSGEKDIYGALYTWAAAMNGANTSSSNQSGIQGICPDGWHIPSDAEWKELEMYLGMSQAEADDENWRGTNEGSKLAGNEALWTTGDLTNNIEFGVTTFNGLPGGYRNYVDGTFPDNNTGANWWSSTESSSSTAWGPSLHYASTGVYRYADYKSGGSSVRCVKDK